jgi:hypothetical protein
MAVRDQIFRSPTPGDAPRETGWTRASDGSKATDAYRRKARHIRKLYGDNPARLHHCLRELCRQQDAKAAGPTQFATGAPRRARSSDLRRLPSHGARDAYVRIDATHSRAAVDWFADRVAAQLDQSPQVLHYSQRVALLKDAARLGIDRFPANLMIATLQHERQSSALPISVDRPEAFILPRFVLPAVIGGIQAAIVLAAWWVLHT